MPRRTMTVPPLDYLQAEATAIRAAHDAQEVRERLREFLTYYEALNYTIQYGSPLLRARKCPDRHGYPKIANVHYPPSVNTPAGRLNEPGSPMLYVCFTQFTVFQEVRAQPGDFLHMIFYSMSRPVRSALIGEFTNVHKRGQGLLPGDISGKLNNMLNNMRPFAGALSFIFMDAFLAGILADPQSEHRDHLHSRTLSTLLFEKYPGIEAIHYPSVARDGAMNLAIKPTAADDALDVAGTSVLSIATRYDYGLYDFKIVRAGSAHGGDIEWREVSDDENRMLQAYPLSIATPRTGHGAS